MLNCNHKLSTYDDDDDDNISMYVCCINKHTY